MLIELPLLNRFKRGIKEETTSSEGKPYTVVRYVCAAGDIFPITVSTEGIRGIQEHTTAKIGASVIGGADNIWPHHKEDFEYRSQILLIDGKWYNIDMDYNTLFVLIATHTKIIPLNHNPIIPA